MEAAMADTKELQGQLFAEMKGASRKTIRRSDEGRPLCLCSAFVTGGEQPRYFRIPRDGNPKDETIRDLLLDGDKEAVGKDYFRLSGIDHTTDHAFGIWAMTTRARNTTRCAFAISPPSRISTTCWKTPPAAVSGRLTARVSSIRCRTRTTVRPRSSTISSASRSRPTGSSTRRRTPASSWASAARCSTTSSSSTSTTTRPRNTASSRPRT